MALIDVNWKPGSRELRQFAALFVVFAVGFGTAFKLLPGFFDNVPSWAPLALWVAGGVVGLFGLLFPKGALPIYIVMMAVALPVGMVVSTVLMIVIFFLVLTPVGMVMRIVGYDPMHRKFDRSASSYWIEREADIEPSRYFRQY